MQTPSQRFRSVQFCICEIFSEMIYLNLKSSVWRRHFGVPLRPTGGNQKKLLSLNLATKA